MSLKYRGRVFHVCLFLNDGDDVAALLRLRLAGAFCVVHKHGHGLHVHCVIKFDRAMWLHAFCAQFGVDASSVKYGNSYDNYVSYARALAWDMEALK